ncbi:MAG: polysaccharide biosynthesis tyrosine autokinase [Verrucomicrobia bacterium]|nr:polysaccharide biosynthesis tyrosine autokinase [Verrucomicrobiota bacterium]
MADVAIQKSAALKFLQGQGVGFDFNRYFFLIRRRLWLLILIVCLGGLGALVFLLREPKVYASRAVVQVEQEEAKVLGSKVEAVQSDQLEAPDLMETIVESLTSNTVLIGVNQALGLDKDPFITKDPFNPPWVPEKPDTELTLADKLRKKIIVTLRRDTRLIDIVAEHTDPVRARDMAAAVVHSYLHQTFEQQFKTLSEATSFLQEEADKLKTKLETSERQLQAYKEQHNAVSLENNEDIITAKLKELNSKAIEAKNHRIQLESDIETLRKIPPSDTERMLQIGSVTQISEVSSRLSLVTKAEADLAALQKRYLQLHPKYIAAVTQIQSLKQSLKEALRDAGKILETEYAAAKESEDKMNEALQDQEKEALGLSKLAIPYNTLQREVDSDKAMYDALQTRIRETSISQGVEKSPFHVIEEPMVTSKAVKPDIPKGVGIALAVSFAVGLTLIILMDYFDDTLRSVDQAEEFLGLPALAVIPEDPRSGNLHSAFESKDSRQAEAFRNLRAAISLLGNDDEARSVFLITSAVPGEGKSFSSLSLAHSFALNGYRTLLIEGDLRRPTFQNAFKDLATHQKVGFTDVLSGNCRADEVAVQTKYENLSVIFAGRSAPHPAELLAAGSLIDVISELKLHFDRIVIDTAPINAVSDTLTMISAVQYVCLIVRPAKTRKTAITRAIHLIAKAKGNLAGFVLNRAKFTVGSGYYYYYYGKKYADKAY